MSMSQNHKFIQDFTAAWQRRTKYFQFTEEWSDCPYYAEYAGIDFTTDNEWYDPKNETFHFGAEYRKENTPDDNLGSYQSSSFRINPVTLTIEADPDDQNSTWYWFTGEFDGHTLKELAKNRTPLDTINPDGAKLAESFYAEVGLQY